VSEKEVLRKIFGTKGEKKQEEGKIYIRSFLTCTHQQTR
jgi:hypothetical protein